MEFLKSKLLPFYNANLLYVKGAIVILYFLFVFLSYWGGIIFISLYGELHFIAEGIYYYAALFYSLFWLYQWVMRDSDNWKKMHKQSLLFTGVLTGGVLLIEYVFSASFLAESEIYEAHLFLHPFKLLFLIFALYALFFLFGKRKFRLSQQRELRIASVPLLGGSVLCIILVLSVIQPVPLLGGFDIFNTVSTSHLFGAVIEIETLLGGCLFFLLWFNTVPRTKIEYHDLPAT